MIIRLLLFLSVIAAAAGILVDWDLNVGELYCAAAPNTTVPRYGDSTFCALTYVDDSPEGGCMLGFNAVTERWVQETVGQAPCTGANICQPSCVRYVGQTAVQFSLLVGSFCGAAAQPIPNSDAALMCSLSKVDIKNDKGKCELRRNANTRVWSARSSGNCTDQECGYSCLVSDKLNVTVFDSQDFAGSNQFIANSSTFDLCALTHVTDDGSLSSSCEVLRSGAAGWKIVGGISPCGYSCATFSSFTVTQPPTPLPTPAPTPPTPAPTPSTTAPPRTTTTTGAGFTPAPISVNVTTTTTRAGTTATATTTTTTSTATTTTATTTTAGASTNGASSSAAATVVATTTTAPEPGVVVVSPNRPNVGDKDSTTIGAGGVTLRVVDYDPNEPISVTVKAPHKLGPSTKLDLRMSFGDVCEFQDTQALMLLTGDGGIATGSFSSIVFTMPDGRPVPTLRQFANNLCDRVSVEMTTSLAADKALLFSVNLTPADCSDTSGGAKITCSGDRPSVVDMPMSMMDGDCEKVIDIFCLWHLIVMGVGACCCFLLCVLLIVCVATRGGDDDDSDDETERNTSMKPLSRESAGASTTASFAAVDQLPIAINTSDRGSAAQLQPATQPTQQFEAPAPQTEHIGTYLAMPPAPGSEGSGFGYGSIAISQAGDAVGEALPEINLDQGQQWAGEQQQQQQWGGEQQWGNGADQQWA